MSFAIITITKNNPNLHKTLDSILLQTKKPSQFILINGGDPLKLTEVYSDCDTLIQESDFGVYDAMNKGIEACQEDHMLFLNAGDELAHPNAVSDIIENLVNCSITSFCMEVCDGKGRRWKLPATAPKHQGMVFPVADKAIKYNSSFKIFADGYYIQQMRELFAEKLSNNSPIRFFLGGVSSDLTLSLCVTAYRECGFRQFIKKIVLYFFSKVFGRDRIRAAIYHIKGYPRIYD